jgi:signal peptidase I
MAGGRTSKEYTEYPARRKRRFRKRAFGLFVLIFAIVLTIAVLSPFFLSSVRMESGAMSPSISISDKVGVNRFAYALWRPRRGDIVQFQTARREGGASSSAPIRRIIGLPGETVQIMDGMVYINGYPIDEAYRSGEMTYAGTAASALTLNSNEYFLMADNRSNNFDSRDATVGPVAEEDILGKVWIRIEPFEQFGLIR